MRYYKILKNDILFSIGTGYGGTEITEAEYNALLPEIREKAALVNRLCNGEITIDDVPTNWQEEMQRRVDERLTEIDDDPDLTAEEALDIILGGTK